MSTRVERVNIQRFKCIRKYNYFQLSFKGDGQVSIKIGSKTNSDITKDSIWDLMK